jgi:hypothetical protein
MLCYFASENYSKATRQPGNKTHTEKLHKMFTSGSNLSVFHAHNTHHQFNDNSLIHRIHDVTGDTNIMRV